ncbi:FecR domain-containing protein [Desulfovibrio sp. JC010]|uniref:FecR domain-containing protein n=1 Tax=Desulfovibrio sp. JC010 TaxID=2593641 RepID=UPI0013D4F223|nr:FecR domain-containing protein [Desulfovibrio sp. JC010]NDV27820.1 hypothetical protein [Desulfovibrio sp. JC010]
MPEQATPLVEIGVVTGLKGEAFAESASGARILSSGSPIYQGEELVTAAGGNVEIRLIDDTLLSQGENSRISLDDYIYDDSTGVGDFLADITQGTFRIVTGEIARQNPDRFKVGTPLATIGIRGTIILSEVGPDGEIHGVEEIHAGKAMLLQSKATGEMRQLFSGQMVDVSGSGLLSQVRPLSARELQNFRDLAPANIRQEQDIRDQREDNQDDDLPEEQDISGEELSGDVVPGGGDILSPDGILGGGIIEGTEDKVEQPVEPKPEKEGEKDEKGLPPEITPEPKPTPKDEEKDKEKKNDDDEITSLLENTDENNDDNDSSKDEPTSDPHNITGSGLIEGTAEADTITGSSSNDTIRGLGGSDTLYGQCGDDTLYGGTGDDIMYGSDGADTLYGEEGSDTLNGGTGTNYIDGGTGAASDVDFVSYADAGGSVNASIKNNLGSTSGRTDFLTNIEGIEGSAHDDELDGDYFANTLLGNGGNDTLEGWEGDDRLDGGAGIDFVSYASAMTGVNVSLKDGTTSGAHGIDTITNVEGIIGSGSGDNLEGDSADNTIQGNAGVDTLYGLEGNNTLEGGAGNDELYGGSDIDTASYANASGGVTVDLTLNTATGADGNDTLNSIENVIGSAYADNITGDGSANTFTDNDTANDVYNGGGGIDTVDYSGITDKYVSAQFDDGKVMLEGQNPMSEYDTITDIEVVIGTKNNDFFEIGNSNATMHAGEGTDNMHCAMISAAININNSTGVATSGSYTYGFSSIETFFATGYSGDVFTGSTSGSETVNLGEGSDTFYLKDSAVTTIKYGTYTNADTIDNFNSGEDNLLFEPFSGMSGYKTFAGFKAYDTVSGTMTVSGSTSAYFVFENDKLYYDGDGDGAGAQKLIATFENSDDVQQSDISFG